MSDIGLHFDGLVALLALLEADGALLPGLVGCLTLDWIRSRRMKTPLRSQPVHRHVVGILTCMAVCSGVGMLIFLHGLKPSPSPLEAWLDRWVFLWVPAIFLLWPLCAAGVRKRQTASRGNHPERISMKSSPIS